MKIVDYKLEAFTCPSCVTKLEKAIGKKKGVIQVETLFHSSKVKVHFDENRITLDDITYIIVRLGFSIVSQTVRGE